MKTFNQQLFFAIILTCILGIGITCCTCKHQERNELTNLTSSTSSDSFPYPGIVYLLPSPSEVLLNTFIDDIAFNPSLLAPENLDKKTIFSHQQAMIMGVYITDLSYNILFKNYTNGINNINTIQNLCQNLGIGSLLTDIYFKRIENNINNIDSIDAVFVDFTQNSFSTLESTGNNELLSLVAIGSGIETMYLSYASFDIETITNRLLPNFLGQRVIYDNYFKNFMNYNYDKPELKTFILDVKSIYSLFKRQVAVKNYSIVTKKKNSQFSIKDRSANTYTKESFQKLGDSIVIVRNKLVGLKYQ